MKIRCLMLLLCAGIQGIWYPAVAQKKVVIMGSSTAAGYGASTYQLSWAGRLESSCNSNKMDGADTIFYNIAVAGYNTYQELPASYSPPAGRPSPDPMADVTRALNYHPDIVIISLPGNDVGAGFSLTETMSNFRLMFNSITASGAACYITTSQPRNDYSVSQRTELLKLKDSIVSGFGNFAIDFWDDLVTPDGMNMLRSDRKDPASLVHPNDTGHNFLFKRLKDKNIFGSAVNNGNLIITKMFVENGGNSLIAEISLQDNQNVMMTIYNSTGMVVRQTKGSALMPSTRMVVPAAGLPCGVYFLKICTNDGNSATKAFIK